MADVNLNTPVVVCHDDVESAAIVTHVHKGKHQARTLSDKVVAVVDAYAFPRGTQGGRVFEGVPVFADRKGARSRNDADDDGDSPDIAVAGYLGGDGQAAPRDEATHAVDASQPDDPGPAPAANASTAAWLDYAIATGAVTREEGEGMGRDYLRERVAEHQG